MLNEMSGGTIPDVDGRPLPAIPGQVSSDAQLVVRRGIRRVLHAVGIGSETQQPLARVVVGSMITAPVLTLLVLPVHRLAEARAIQQDAGALPGGAFAADGRD